MSRYVTAQDARRDFHTLIREVETTHELAKVTRNGQPAVVIIAAADYESMLETLALANSPDELRAVAEADADIAAGNLTSGPEMLAILRQQHGPGFAPGVTAGGLSA